MQKYVAIGIGVAVAAGVGVLIYAALQPVQAAAPAAGVPTIPAGGTHTSAGNTPAARSLATVPLNPNASSSSPDSADPLGVTYSSTGGTLGMTAQTTSDGTT